MSLSLVPRDLGDSAVMFAALHGLPTFTTREFSEFMNVAAFHLDEELANEILLQVVADGLMREVGPGVYALVEKPEAEAFEQPLWPEEAGR